MCMKGRDLLRHFASARANCMLRVVRPEFVQGHAVDMCVQASWHRCRERKVARVCHVDGQQVKTTFIKKPLSSKNHFHQKTTFIKKPLSSKTTFIKKPLSSKSQFHQRPISPETFLSKPLSFETTFISNPTEGGTGQNTIGGFRG